MVLGVLAFGLGCGGDGPTEPASLVGIYQLATVNGEVLPAAVSATDGTGGTVIQVLSGVLNMLGDGAACSFLLGVRVQPINAPEQSKPLTPGCAYARVGNSVSIKLGEWGTHTASFARSNGVRSLTFEMGSGFGVLRFTDE
jgi:hypothetical protein